MGDDADADGDKDGEEVEDGDDADDDKLYCFCQTSSYGDVSIPHILVDSLVLIHVTDDCLRQ